MRSLIEAPLWFSELREVVASTFKCITDDKLHM
jgi:hypothetical protein